MRYEEGRLGRIFVLRLEDGDRLPDVVEEFAAEKEIRSGLVFLVGGIGEGSRMVVGPEREREDAIVPMILDLHGAQEILGVGTLFPDADDGTPVLHLHAAAGREGKAVVGCTRVGVETWLVGEVIILEMVGLQGSRRKDPDTGFNLLSLD